MRFRIDQAPLHVAWIMSLSLVGCDPTSSSVGSNLAAIEGQACQPDSAKSPAADGCNTCTCRQGEWSCSTHDCSECPPPRAMGNEMCEATGAAAHDPETGACCSYESSCAVPDGMQAFHSLEECLEAVDAPVGTAGGTATESGGDMGMGGANSGPNHQGAGGLEMNGVAGANPDDGAAGVGMNGADLSEGIAGMGMNGTNPQQQGTMSGMAGMADSGAQRSAMSGMGGMDPGEGM